MADVGEGAGRVTTAAALCKAAEREGEGEVERGSVLDLSSCASSFFAGFS